MRFGLGHHEIGEGARSTRERECLRIHERKWPRCTAKPREHLDQLAACDLALDEVVVGLHEARATGSRGDHPEHVAADSERVRTPMPAD